MLRKRFVRAVVLVLMSVSMVAIAGTRASVSEASANGGRTMTLLSVVSSKGDPVGRGKSWSFTQDSGTVQFGGSEGQLGFRLLANNTDYQVQLAAPAGKQLTTGTYRSARRAGLNGAHPGLWVAGNGEGCNTITGSYVIHSIVADTDGNVRQLDVSFTQYCDDASAPLHGRLLVNMPRLGPLALTSSHPITVKGEPTSLTALAHPGSRVRFYDGRKTIGSAKAGAHGVARITTSDLDQGTHYLTAQTNAGTSSRLVQVVYPPTNSFWYHSLGGDELGSGSTASYTPKWSSISFTGTTKQFTVSVATNHSDWLITLQPPAGQLLHKGAYKRSVGIAGGGAGRSCSTEHGSLTIHSIRSTARGRVTSTRLTFAIDCAGSKDPYTGVVNFDV
jgi:hypothetical protein